MIGDTSTSSELLLSFHYHRESNQVSLMVKTMKHNRFLHAVLKHEVCREKMIIYKTLAEH